MCEKDETMIIYARKYLDDMLHIVKEYNKKEEIKECMKWLKELYTRL